MPEVRTSAEFSAVATRKVLDRACAPLGLDPGGAELMRLGENAIYGLHTAPVVVRIARSMDALADVQKEVRVARWLAACGYPAVRLADVCPVEDLPLIVDGHPVTFWEHIEASEVHPTPADLGSLMRQLHDLPIPEDLGLPSFEPFARVESRLAAVPSSVAASDAAFLRQLFESLREQLAEMSSVFPPGPVHGDAHLGNTLRTHAGDVVLLDFEAFSYGPREWDLSLTCSYRHGFAWLSEAEYRAFTDAYGYDVAEWSGFPMFRSVRELTMTTWLMQMVDSDPAIAAEFRRRVKDLRSGTYPRRWKAF